MVISMYGGMFAAHPALAAFELLRVCAPGGKFALANWTPSGFIGQMLKTVGAHLPPSPGSTSPILWGGEETGRERLGQVTISLQFKTRQVIFEYPFSPAETVDFFIEGLKALRVAGASIMTGITNCPTNTTYIMLGKKPPA